MPLIPLEAIKIYAAAKKMLDNKKLGVETTMTQTSDRVTVLITLTAHPQDVPSEVFTFFGKGGSNA